MIDVGRNKKQVFWCWKRAWFEKIERRKEIKWRSFVFEKPPIQDWGRVNIAKGKDKLKEWTWYFKGANQPSQILQVQTVDHDEIISNCVDTW